MVNTAEKLSETTGTLHYLEEEIEALFTTDPKLWRFIQQGSLDGVWYWDLENPQVEWMSPEFWTVLGIDPATKKHDPAEWQGLIHPEDLQVALKNFDAHLADPDVPYDQLVRYWHADGGTVWVRCRGIAIRDAGGRPVRMLGAHNDVTAMKEAELKSMAEARKVKLANDELQAFAYGAAHDLKAPTNTSVRLLEAIMEDGANLTEEQIRFISHALDTLNRMQVLVDDVLEYATVIELDRERTAVDLAAVLEEVVQDCEGAIARTGGNVVVDGTLPVIHGSVWQMWHLIQHLVSNALKYHRPGVPPQVRISSDRSPDGWLSLRVSDNGQGISPQHQAQIFDLFSRLHRHDEVAGSGLGLALCQRIAVSHGGSIRVTSEPGQGSTFHIEFPEAGA